VLEDRSAPGTERGPSLRLAEIRVELEAEIQTLEPRPLVASRAELTGEGNSSSGSSPGLLSSSSAPAIMKTWR
jgi:hypothetical protein